MKHPNVAQRFIEAMNENNLKIVELAEKSGVPKGTISRYVNGINAPTNVIAGKIADVLNVAPMWLMGFPDAPKYTSQQMALQIETEQNNYIKDDFITRMAVYCTLLNKNQLKAVEEFVRDMIKSDKST